MLKKLITKIYGRNNNDGKTDARPKLVCGFTILFAVIVSSLILALGLGIVAITMKEVKLSGAGRDSQLAFYAADSGLECAMYYDIVKYGFATSSSLVGLPSITCNGNSLTVDPGLPTPDSATSTFRMYMEYAGAVPSSIPVVGKPCADVAVIKYVDTGQAKTKIDSRGYNTCDENNSRRLERGYSVEYDNN
jgi:Tfp pilus assembly protein PilX